MTSKAFFAIILAAFAAFLQATVLSDLAASMRPGEWRYMQTAGVTAAFGHADGGAVGNVLPYTDDLAWDPNTRRVYFIGSDHQHGTGMPRFICYSETTNTWTRLAQAPFFPSLTEDAMHGYEHTTINPATGELYHRPASSRSLVARYSTQASTWRSGIAIPPSIQPAPNVAIGIAYYPEMPGIVCVDGNGGLIYAFSMATLKWSILRSGLSLGPYHNMVEYNPVHKVMVGGGGNGSSALYKIDAAGNVTALKSAPFEVRVLSTVFTVDPAGGDYLFFTGSRQFYSYDVQRDAWTGENGAGLPIYANNEGGAVSCVAATPVSTHGVNLFVSCNGSDTCWVSLYKRTAAASAAEKPAAGPCVSSGRAILYDLTGKVIKSNIELSAGGQWVRDAGGLPSGVYLLKVSGGRNHYVKKLLLQR